MADDADVLSAPGEDSDVDDGQMIVSDHTAQNWLNRHLSALWENRRQLLRNHRQRLPEVLITYILEFALGACKINSFSSNIIEVSKLAGQRDLDFTEWDIAGTSHKRAKLSPADEVRTMLDAKWEEDEDMGLLHPKTFRDWVTEITQEIAVTDDSECPAWDTEALAALYMGSNQYIRDSFSQASILAISHKRLTVLPTDFQTLQKLGLILPYSSLF